MQKIINKKVKLHEDRELLRDTTKSYPKDITRYNAISKHDKKPLKSGFLSLSLFYIGRRKMQVIMTEWRR